MKGYQNNGSSQCWQNCGCRAAGHYHVFWECPNIQNYWKDIHKAIQDVFNTHIPFDFKIMYLSYIPPELSAIDKYFMGALLAAGKKALTKRWMLQTGPTIDNWIDVTIEIYTMEKVTFSLNLKLDVFMTHWEKWVHFIRPLRPDFVKVTS